MLHSETIGEISKAIVKAQAQLDPVPRTGENPHFKSKYTPLHEIVKVCRPVLEANGLAVLQTFSPAETSGVVIVTTTLLHESGEWIAGTLTMPTAKDGPQAVGSAITYARRYTLAAILGIVADMDDDAEGAETRQGQPKASDTTADDPLGDLF